MTKTALDFALDYAHRGWYVFPIARGTKVPFKDFSWPTQSTNNPALIAAAAEHPKYAGCNWALDCGRSNVFVLDVDTKQGVTAALADLPTPESPLVVSTPSGGCHYYFQGQGPNSASRIGAGLDTRGVGGYVLIPGSRLSNGAEYALAEASGELLPLSLPPTPAWLTAKLGAAPPPVTRRGNELACDPDTEPNILRAIKYLKEEAPHADTGARDSTCLAVANRIADEGVAESTAVYLMRELYADKVDLSGGANPFTLKHIEKCTRQAYKTRRDPIGVASPDALFGPVKPSGGELDDIFAGDIDVPSIPKRRWLLDGDFIKKFITVTAAPGGTGKSSLALIECLAMASGKKLTYADVIEKGNAWYYSTEEPIDELQRRIAAAARHHGIELASLGKRLRITSGKTLKLKIAKNDKKLGLIANESAIQYLITEIKKHDIKLFVVDPLVRAHQCAENENVDMDFVVDQFQRVADETDCSINLVHHTSKGSTGRDTADKIRGAGALVAATRIARVLYTMSPKDGKEYGLSADDCWDYCCVNDPKANMNRRSSGSKWFKMIPVRLDIDDKYTVATMERVALEKVALVDQGEDAVNELLLSRAATHVLPGSPKSIFDLSLALESEGLTGRKRKWISVRLKEIFASCPIIDGWVYRLCEIDSRRGGVVEGVRCEETPDGVRCEMPGVEPCVS